MIRYGFALTVLFCGVLTVFAGGCGRAGFTFVPIDGTVTIAGRPLANVDVVFLADPDAGTVGPRASGTTDEAGHYRLRTDDGNDGAVAGKHLVLIFDREVALKVAMDRFGKRPPKEIAGASLENAKRLQNQLKGAPAASRVPFRYGRINETPLRVEVQPGSQVIDIDVKDTET